MARVASDDSLSRKERNRSNHGIHVSYWLPLTLEVSDNPAVLFACRSVEGKDREGGEDSSDAGECSSGVACEMSTAEQLGHVDRRRGQRFPLAGEEGQLAKGVGMSPNEANKAIGVENRH